MSEPSLVGARRSSQRIHHSSMLIFRPARGGRILGPLPALIVVVVVITIIIIIDRGGGV